MPDFDTSIWFGLLAPLGTSKEIVDTLAKRGATKAPSSRPIWMPAWKPQGIDRCTGGPGRVLRQHLEQEVKRWNDVAMAAGLKK